MAHHISCDSVWPSASNLKSITECAPPANYTTVCNFLGMANHYRHFIKSFAKIADPLYEILNGDAKDKKKEAVQLSDKAVAAFNELKAHCVSAPVLSFANFTKLFLLKTDASGDGLGVVLSQKQNDRRYHPVAFGSSTLSKSQKNYHSNKKEFLALKWAITEEFQEYLKHSSIPFVVKIDNNPLTYAFTTPNLVATGHRCVAALAPYNFSLEYQ